MPLICCPQYPKSTFEDRATDPFLHLWREFYRRLVICGMMTFLATKGTFSPFNCYKTLACMNLHVAVSCFSILACAIAEGTLHIIQQRDKSPAGTNQAVVRYTNIFSFYHSRLSYNTILLFLRVSRTEAASNRNKK